VLSKVIKFYCSALFGNDQISHLRRDFPLWQYLAVLSPPEANQWKDLILINWKQWTVWWEYWKDLWKMVSKFGHIGMHVWSQDKKSSGTFLLSVQNDLGSLWDLVHPHRRWVTNPVFFC
jgi:hypothetical protein